MKHLNGTLGWIPSDKPVCVQEGKVLPSTPYPHPMEATHVVSLWLQGYEAVCQTGRYPGLLSVSGLILQADGGACMFSKGWGRG